MSDLPIPAHGASTEQEPLHMQDAPELWLSQLIDAAEPSEKVLLFSCSSQLRDLTLANSRSVQLTLSPDTDPKHTAAAQSLLHLPSCREGATVRLVVKNWPGEKLPASQASKEWLLQLCSKPGRVPGLPLQHITHLELLDPMEKCLLPLEVAAACPNLWHLTCPFTTSLLTVNAKAPALWPQLRSLTLTGCDQLLQQPAQGDVSHNRIHSAGMASFITKEALAVQIRLAQNLTTLQLRPQEALPEDNNAYQIPHRLLLCLTWGDSWLQTLTKVAVQLHMLQLPDVCWMPSHLVWSHLTDLDLREGHILIDAGLVCIVRNCPQLTHLAASSICLRSSFSTQQCNLQDLTVYGFLGTKDLALLPLQRLRTLRIGSLVHTQDEAGVSAAVTSLPAVCKLCTVPGQDAYRVVLQGKAQLASMAPMIARLPQHPAVIAMSVDLLIQQVGSAALLGQVPNTSALQIMPGVCKDVSQIMESLQALCRQALRPVQVQVWRQVAEQLPSDWMLRLYDVAVQAGHDHVTASVCTSSEAVPACFTT